MVTTTLTLPALRQDLALHKGLDTPDGAPTWTLHDPAANRFYQLGWPVFELMSRWSAGEPQALLAAVNRETTLRVTPADLDELLRMLRQHNLLVAQGAEDTRRLATQASMLELTAAQWLLKNYLYLRLPLLRPTRWLQRTGPWLGWAFQPVFWGGVAALAALGLGLAAQRWDEFTHTFVSHANWQGLLVMFACLSASKVVHELGHACTATRYGCRVPTMGVAFLVMWPVLYTDTNEAWKLKSRRERLAIGAAGMLAELALASVALVAWSVMPESPAWGPARSAAFVLATSTWLLTLAINASPFMRFDGYFLLSDLIGMPNLHERSFALARWWLRERLFGWGDAPPERFTPVRHGGLIAFAFATWFYRLVLFTGIALLVYHAFFKALGVVLMAVEVGWFIVRPVWRELHAWWQRRGDLRWNRACTRTVMLLCLSAGMVLWPWQTVVRAPAVLGALRAQALYVPHAGQLSATLPAPGEQVQEGRVLVQLQSPELSLQLALARAREQQLQWQLSQQPFDEGLRDAGPALRKRWEAAAGEVAGLQAEIRQLSLTAPFAGSIVDVVDDARPGNWLARGERLLHMVSPRGTKVDVFVDEASLAGVAAGQAATFVPKTLEEPVVRCRVERIEAVQLGSLDEPGVASIHGGDIPAHRTADGRLQPLQPVFRVRLEHCDRDAPPRSEQMGVAHLQGERQSWIARAARRAIGVWQRESAL